MFVTELTRSSKVLPAPDLDIALHKSTEQKRLLEKGELRKCDKHILCI